MRAINTYFNQIRRSASILERALVSARGKVKVLYIQILILNMRIIF